MTTPDNLNESNHPEDPARRRLERLSWNEPFDKEAFLNNPAPSIFDPDQVVRASKPFDVDEFISYIRESRDDSTE